MNVRQAITTKYLGPTNFRESRIKVRCAAKTIIVPWNHAIGIEGNHRMAADKLIAALGWVAPFYGKFVQGCLPDNTGYVFVMCELEG